MGAAFGGEKPKRPKSAYKTAKRVSIETRGATIDHPEQQSEINKDSERVKLERMTRKEQIIYQRTKKRKQLEADRQASKNKREKSRKTQYYGILGLNSAESDDPTKITSSKES